MIQRPTRRFKRYKEAAPRCTSRCRTGRGNYLYDAGAHLVAHKPPPYDRPNCRCCGSGESQRTSITAETRNMGIEKKGHAVDHGERGEDTESILKARIVKGNVRPLAFDPMTGYVEVHSPEKIARMFSILVCISSYSRSGLLSATIPPPE